MMALLLLFLAPLLVNSLQKFVDIESRVISNRTMEAGDSLTVVSGGFPECCEKDFAFYIQCSTKDCGLNILFVDVDLPEEATIEVYDGWSSQSNLLAASTLAPSGVWTRPSLVHTAGNLTLVLSVYEHARYHNHSGVKVQVDAFNTVTAPVRAAVTSLAACGSINLHNWKGGELKLAPTTDEALPTTTLDCIWLLKTPPEVEGLHAFVRFTYTNNLHAILEVRRGTSSAAPEIFFMNAGDRPAVIMQGKEGFSSSDGLYIRVRKQLQAGELTFVYGLYAIIPAGLNTAACDITPLGRIATLGFPCAELRWCIPAVDQCDGVQQCHTGEDEADCQAATTKPTAKTSATGKPKVEKPKVCWAWEKSCLDGSCVMIMSSRCPGECWTWERKCPDGTCLLNGMQCPGECRSWERKCGDGSCILGDRCPGECLQFEKKCSDGLCIDKFKFCPAEPCPADLRHRCADQCYGEDERCNQVEFCKDGSDENFCSMPSLWGSSFTYVAIPMLGAIFFITICVLYALRKRSSANEGGRHLPPITSSHGAGTGDFTGDSDSVTVDVTDSPTAPLTRLTEAQAPPPYAEAMGTSYYQPETQLIGDQQGALPPPYEQVATENTIPSKTSV